MSNANGVIRFSLFVAVIGLIAVGVYANSLRHQLADREAAITTLTTERDASSAKAEEMQSKGTASATALEQAQAQIKDLQSQLEAEKAKAPPSRVRAPKR
jgi:phage shock protein A